MFREETLEKHRQKFFGQATNLIILSYQQGKTLKSLEPHQGGFVTLLDKNCYPPDKFGVKILLKPQHLFSPLKAMPVEHHTTVKKSQFFLPSKR